MIGIARRRTATALVWLHGLAVAAAVVLWLGSRIFHHLPHTSWVQTVFTTLNVPVSASLIPVVGLGVVTEGLLHRRRLALVAVAVIQVFGAIWSVADLSALISGRGPLPSARDGESLTLTVVSLVVAVVMLGVVVWLRPAFPARSAPGSWWAAGAFLGAGLLLAVVATSVLVRVAPGSTGSVAQQVFVSVLRAAGLHAPTSLYTVHVAHFVPQVTSVIVGVAIVGAVAVFLRSSRNRDQWQPSQEVEIRQLLHEFGEADSLGYTATRRDKLLHFDSHRRAAISYQVFGSVCLASGDPIGDPQAWPEAIWSWEALARSHGWTPAVLACGEPGARAYAQHLGLDVLRLGDEAVLHPHDFLLESTSMTEVRRAWRRARRDGLVVRIARQQEWGPDELRELRGLASRWRGAPRERGFSMALGRFGDPADAGMVICLVRDSDGAPLALISLCPWGRRGLSLDLMRRSPTAPHGVVEFLVTELMAWGREHAIERVSLNFAMLRQVFARGEDVAAAPLDKVGSQLVGTFDRFWQLQRLYRANEKYHPEWQPRYLAVPTPLVLPAVTLAAMVAEGFLPGWVAVRHSHADGSAALPGPELEQVRSLAIAPRDDWWETTPEQTRHRVHHLAQLRALGQSGYPVGHRPGLRLAQAPLFDQTPPADEAVTVVGRIRAVRDHGGVCFADLVDLGRSVQLLLDAATLGRGSLHEFTRLVDLGDLVEVVVVPGSSRSGARCWLVHRWTVVAKCLRPIPWRAPAASTVVKDRPLHMVVHPDQVEVLRSRSRAINAVRRTLLDDGFTEVETPILTAVHGGAGARPFRTHLNAHDTDLVLRIAPELALKGLLVGGMGPIFEVGRNFRNEGVDGSHNPEFTVVEAYQPFADYHDMRHLTQRLVQSAATAIHGRPVMPLGDGPDGSLCDISGDWPVIPVLEAVSLAVDQQVSLADDVEVLLQLAHRHGVAVGNGWGPGAVIEKLYGDLVESRTLRPTFYIDFPEETSPLTAPHRTLPGLVERWDLVAHGMELGTAYSELADPLVQRQRLVAQSRKAALGDPEAMEVDEDFLAALELGMPPTGGLGLGLDRVLMVLTGASLRQVLSYPLVPRR